MMLLSCSECGVQYYAKRSQVVNYHSDACKQKAYRRRKRQKKEAENRTMNMDEYRVFQDVEALTNSLDTMTKVGIVLGTLRRSDWLFVLEAMRDVATSTAINAVFNADDIVNALA